MINYGTQMGLYLEDAIMSYCENISERNFNIIADVISEYPKSQAVKILADDVLITDLKLDKYVFNEIDKMANDRNEWLNFMNEYQIFEWYDLERKFQVNIVDLGDVMKYGLYDEFYNELDIIADYIYDYFDETIKMALEN